MPNWVYNQVTISGDRNVVLLAKAQLADPYTRKQHVWSNTELKLVDVEIDMPFSFWNIIRPDDSILDEYFSVQPVDKSGSHWYNCNINHWGCKWDASDVQVVDETEDASENSYAISYTFSTPWSPPLEAILLLSLAYPELLVEISYEEEQGWGGNAVIRDSEIISSEEYDIPDSHKDYEERDKDCICEWQDTEDWFKDCPADPEEWEWIDDEMGRSWGNWKLKQKNTSVQ
jgi:hypothetical protein